MANEKILTGVKHIYFTPWKNEAGVESLDTSKRFELNNVIADTVAISQDDPETNTIDCETRDEPIIEATTLGNYTITMDSADIALDILVNCLGYSKNGSDIAYAPTAYTPNYAMIEVEMSSDKFIAPRLQMNAKLDASSLKTGVAKGTISGSARSATVSVGSNSFDTPFFVADKKYTPVTPGSGEVQFSVSKLNDTGSGSGA